MIIQPGRARQLRQVSPALQALGVRPVSLWDSEYGCAPFIVATQDIPADKLVRLRPNLCLWGPSAPYRRRGRPAVHGGAFKLREPLTWGQPANKLELTDPVLGRVQVLVWRQLHFRKAASQALLVGRIERLEAAHTARDPGVLWLAWIGTEPHRWQGGGIGTCAGLPSITGIASPSSASTGRCPAWPRRNRPSAGVT